MDGQPMESRQSVILLCMSGVPFLLAFVFTQVVPAGRVANGSVERPALAFMQHAVDLGEVPSTGTIPGFFDFWNRGESSIEISEIKPSCECLGPKLAAEKRVYEPGERGRIFVSVATANEQSGAKHYTLAVAYRELLNPKSNQNSAKQKRDGTESVTFKMTIPERKVTVTPSEVYFYQLSGVADHREIIVADHRGSKLEIVDASVSSEYASITVGEAHLTGRGVWETPVRIDVEADIPSGRQIAFATILTSDPDYDRIRIPILIEGKSSKIQLTSGTDDVPEADDGSKKYRFRIEE